jgi:hypothetical protein
MKGSREKYHFGLRVIQCSTNEAAHAPEYRPVYPTVAGVVAVDSRCPGPARSCQFGGMPI